MNSVRRQCCDKDEAGWFVTHGTGASLREYVYWGSQQIALAVKGTSSTPATSLLDESSVSFQGSHIITTNNANYLGTGFIDYVGEGQANWIFYAPSSTTYNIKLRYSLGNTANRPLALLVDGVQKSLINFTPTATWAIWNTLELSVTTPQGNHTISLKTTGKSGPNVDQMELNYTVAGTASSLYFVHNDHLNTPQVVTDSAQQVVWMGDYQPLGKLAQNQNNSIELYSRFPGQYLDGETGLYYNYFRDYDPSIGRYIESDPIGLAGGINTYAYVSGNPISFIDPLGLKKWDWDGWGDTSVCKYYEDLAEKTCSEYYKAAAKICRGQNASVNAVMSTGIAQSWAAGNTSASQSEIANQIRQSLISQDQIARAVNNRGNFAPRGDHIDQYHNAAFQNAGINPIWYGGNLWPQGVWPNPVPYDPIGNLPFDPRTPVLPSGDGQGEGCGCNQ